MKRNAFFQLVHKEDGIFLKSYPAVDGGEPLKADDVLSYLVAKKWNDVPTEQIKVFVEKAAKKTNAEIQISKKSAIPENEYAVITVDPNRLYAKLRLYPNSSLGSRLTVEDILKLLEQHDVSYGIIRKNIEIMHKMRLYCTDVLVAKATPPVHGHDAVITYHFDLDKTSKPAVKEVANKHLKHGKHIHLSEDSLSMYSDVSGNVTCVDETVFVSDCYEVPADVGPSTGDIEYEGSVNVKGNVLTGYTVQATGDIYVAGAVEGATLIAGGKIVLNRGIQGKGTGKMEAGGDIISNFIESSTVNAGGKIVTDALMHSNVVAKDVIEVNGKRGLIAGGSVRSTQKIETKVAGSSMGTQTELEVGIDPNCVDRYHAIEKEMEELSDEKDKVLQTIEVLKKRFKAIGSLEPEKLEMLKSGKVRLDEIDGIMDTLTAEYDELGHVLESSSGKGKIVVYDIAYSGVKLTISNVTNYLHSEVHRSTFVREGADIRVRAV